MQWLLTASVTGMTEVISFTVKTTPPPSLSVQQSGLLSLLDLGSIDKNMGFGFKRGAHCRICNLGEEDLLL